MIRGLINSQMELSSKFDTYLPNKYSIDGNSDYQKFLVPKYLKQNLTIYDVGGGKRPYISLKQKKDLNATIIGLDIDREELDKAPDGSYDRTICADIAKFEGNRDADLLICQAVLEHVADVESAFSSISSILKPGGLALIFVPSKNAVFARLNIILPQEVKKTILYTIYPKMSQGQGFPSYYNKCTPKEFKQLARENDCDPIEENYYYMSSYFSFFFPAYFAWRLWILLFHRIFQEQAAETFSLVLKKKDLVS
jgi:2-polyprenyl-6-hydroxyphenyl methylase/3-demethylubiquinone-9 3-methyltransferase